MIREDKMATKVSLGLVYCCFDVANIALTTALLLPFTQIFAIHGSKGVPKDTTYKIRQKDFVKENTEQFPILGNSYL